MAAGGSAATSIWTSYRLTTVFVLTTVALVHSSGIGADLVGRFRPESRVGQGDIWRRNAERLSFDVHRLRRRRDDAGIPGDRQRWGLGPSPFVDVTKVDEQDNEDDDDDNGLQDLGEDGTFEEDRIVMLARQLVGTQEGCDGIGTCAQVGGGDDVVNMQKRPGKWI